MKRGIGMRTRPASPTQKAAQAVGLRVRAAAFDMPRYCQSEALSRDLDVEGE